jgi:hypothetical protein
MLRPLRRLGATPRSPSKAGRSTSTAVRYFSDAAGRAVYLTGAHTWNNLLFEGWGLQHLPEAWRSHPFHPSNNVHGLDGDAGGDGRGLLTHTLKLPAVTRLRESYATEPMAVEWIAPVAGTSHAGKPAAGGGKHTLQAPFRGPAVLVVGETR